MPGSVVASSPAALPPVSARPVAGCKGACK
jgi:hypothetical protein